MKMRLRSYLLTLFGILLMVPLRATITFLDSDAKLVLGAGNFPGEVLMNTSASFQSMETGQIVITNPNNIIGSSGRLFFQDGILSNDDYSAVLTGTYDPSYTYSIVLAGNGQFYVTNPGKIPQRIWISGASNRIEGQPTFKSSNALKIANHLSDVTMAIQTELNQNMELEGGTVNLDDNLSLGDSVRLTGSGTINFNSFNLSTGQKDLVWTDTLKFVGAKNLVFGGDSKLFGQWRFQNDARVLGNNNVLDISPGSTIWIRPNTTVEMFDLTLDGFGTGCIILDDTTSKLDLYNVIINMNGNYTFTGGRIYVSGPSRIVTGSSHLNFDQKASFTVDGATVEYDTLDYNDENNVRIGDTGYKNTPRWVTYLRGGSIRKKESLKVGPHRVSADTKQDRSFKITTLRKQIIDVADPIVDGDGFDLEFALNPSEAILTIGASQYLKYINITLKNFPFGTPGLSYGAGAKIEFGAQTTIELGENSTLNNTFYFSGQTVLNGKGKILELGASGEFILRPGASLYIDNITLRGISENQIRCMDDSCTVSLGDVTWEQDGDYTFTKGTFYVKGLWDLKGTSTFGYQASRPSLISRFGTIYVDEGMSFSYAPPIANRDLITFENSYATLHLNGATLMSTTTGMRLSKGTLFVDGHSYIDNRGAVARTEAISFGKDGIVGNDLTVTIGPSAQLELLFGVLFYDQED